MTSVTVGGYTTGDIHTARDAAGAGGKIRFPAGQYDVDGLTASQPDQTWILDRYATIKRTSTSLTPLLTLTASGLRLRGGTWDGNRTGNINPGVGFEGHNCALDGRGFTLQNISSWGVGLDNSDMILMDVLIKNVANAGIIWRNTDLVARHGPLFERVTVDRSTENLSTVSSGGILIQASSGKWVINPRVINCEVILPETSADHAVCFEILNSQHARLLNNKALSGRIGLSFGNVSYGIITGNIAQAQSSYAIELAQASASCNVQANNCTGYVPTPTGIEVSGASNNNKLVGNCLGGFSQNVTIHSGCTGNVDQFNA